MATRNEKTVQEYLEGRTPERKERSKKSKEKILTVVPTKVEKGSHLTVTTFPDGRTTLEWDDVALLKEVRDAIANSELAQLKPAVRAKAGARKRKTGL
jgi:YD repeat-containing protein